jgi:hypothetical protein
VKPLCVRVTETILPERRLVLVDASNLTRSLATAIQTAQAIWKQSLVILIAVSRGCSYGSPSRFLGRSLLSILSWGLQDGLQAGPTLPMTALWTDIGNNPL